MGRSRWYGGTALVILCTLGFVWWVYPQLPARVPSHWNINGDIDGYADPLTASLLFPGLLLLVSGLLVGFSRVERNARVADALAQMSTVMALFLSAIHVVVTLAAIGAGLSVERWIAGLLGALFIAIATMMRDIPPNGFFGIRTYWTLANPQVWSETHHQATRWMIAAGVVTFLLALLPIPAVWLFGGMMTAIIGSVTIPMVYAYRRFHALVG